MTIDELIHRIDCEGLGYAIVDYFGPELPVLKRPNVPGNDELEAQLRADWRQAAALLDRIEETLVILQGGPR